MKVKVIWYMLIKMAGLWYLYNALHFIFMYSRDMVFMFEDVNQDMSIVITTVLIVGIDALIGTLLLYKTHWIITTLKLMDGMEDESFDIHTNRITFVKLSVLLFAIVLFVMSLSEFFMQLYILYQNDVFFNNSPEAKYIVFHGVKAFIAYLMLTNLTFIANFIESKLKQNSKEIDDIEIQ